MMDIEKLIHCLQCCARVDAHNVGCDDCGLEYCGPECQQLCGTAATVLSTLQGENESLKEKLYDGEGVNLVDYWMQQAKIEENGHRNCQAENEKLRSDLRRLQTERDTLWAANQHLLAERDAAADCAKKEADNGN